MIVARIRKRLECERGVALIVAVSVMTVLSMTIIATIDYTASNQRTAAMSKTQRVAFTLAEAGLNNIMAVLSNPTNNALKQETLPACTNNPQTNWNHSYYEQGQVDWCGDLVLAESAWKIKAIGMMKNPTGNQNKITRTLTAYVPVQPTVTQPLNNPAWNYIFATNTGATCDITLNENVTMESALFVEGNLCMNNNSHVRVGPLIVKRRLSLQSANADVGTATMRVETHVGGYDTGTGVKHCKMGNQHRHSDSSHATHAFCSDVDNVFSKRTDGTPGVSSTPPNLSKPSSDWDHWYENAIPGPKQECTTRSGPAPTWESVGNTARDNSVGTAFNLTPATDYTCRVGSATSPFGELSWNATTRTLKITGTMFIDGSVYSNNGLLNQYNGQGTLYISGTFLLDNNTKLCGGNDGSNCAFSTWNPNTELFVMTANGAGTGAITLDNGSQWQGALYATNGITLNNNSKTDGPMVAGTIVLNQNYEGDDFGTISSVPAGMPGSPQVYAQPNSPSGFSG